MKCDNCKTNIPDDASFCPQCGQALLAEANAQRVCEHCGIALPDDAAFCPECGQKWIQRAAGEVIAYDIDVPILTTWPIISQVSIPFLLFGGLMVFLAIVGGDIRQNYGFWFVGVFLLISIIVSWLMMGGRYDVHVRLDSKGANVKTREKQAKRIKVVSWLNLLSFFFRGNLSAPASSYAAMSQLDTFIEWEDVRKANFTKGGRYIHLKAGVFASDKVMVFCSAENYEAVSAFIRARLPKTTAIKDN